MALLVYADADGVERQITVGAEPVTVGRANECIIRSSDPRMSRNHARFFLDPFGALHVEDLGSSNGVWIGQTKVQVSPVPVNELVVVGSVVFRLMPMQPAQPIQQVDWQQPGTQPAAPPWQQQQQPAPPPYEPPPPPPAPPLFGAPAAPQAPQANANTELLEAERKARQAAEEERDAYGARMAQLHGEVRTLQQELAKARIPAAPADIQQRIQELEDERTNLTTELESARDRANGAEARLRSAEEELEVARTDVMKAEERIISEIRAHEERSATELKMRMEELDVARTDVVKAEERILDLSRTNAELENKIRELEAKLSGRLD